MGERHGHGLKGNSTQSHVGPKTSAALFSVGSDIFEHVFGHTPISDVTAGVSPLTADVKHLL